MLLKNWIIILKLLVCLYNVQFSLLIVIVMHNFLFDELARQTYYLFTYFRDAIVDNIKE